MSYAVAAALQAAIFDRLRTDTALAALVGDAIYDAVPPGPVPPLYVVLGAEEVRDASDKTGAGAAHLLRISVITDKAGFAAAKAAAGAVSDALIDAPMPLSRGTLVSLFFVKARAARLGSGDRREVQLTFRARTADQS